MCDRCLSHEEVQMGPLEDLRVPECEKAGAGNQGNLHSLAV